MLIQAVAFALASWQQHPGVDACTRAHTTVQMEECLKAQLVQEDASLEASERRLRKRLSPAALQKFDSAATTWRAYREQECRGVYEASTGGTIAASSLLGCKIELAKGRRLLILKVYPTE